MAERRNLLVIIGPTASGKSDLGMRLASHAGGQILSVDSMQIYRGMDIGTAKPTCAERSQVPHHLLDIVAPNDPFTVARFVQMADQIIHAAAAADTPLIATGGTPLYFKSLFEGLFDGPAADESLRARLRLLSNNELHAQLKQVDPVAAARIHINDTKRLIRALEVYKLSGQPISSQQTEWQSASVRHQAKWIGLAWEREALNRRINARVKAMIAGGWVDEVRALLARYGSLSPTAAEATGYRQIIDHVQGLMSLEDAVEQIKIATRQLARRQMKWFKRFSDVHWLNGDMPPDELFQQAEWVWRES